MGLLIGLLSVVMVLSSLFLIFLILLQLPKKEAGAGIAFGASTADSLFGAGSGNVLTKLTKYSTITFLVLALVLSVLQNHHANRGTKGFTEKLKGKETAAVAPTPTPAPAIQPANVNAALQTASNGTAPLLLTQSNSSPAAATPAPVKK